MHTSPSPQYTFGTFLSRPFETLRRKGPWKRYTSVQSFWRLYFVFETQNGRLDRGWNVDFEKPRICLKNRKFLWELNREILITYWWSEYAEKERKEVGIQKGKWEEEKEICCSERAKDDNRRSHSKLSVRTLYYFFYDNKIHYHKFQFRFLTTKNTKIWCISMPLYMCQILCICCLLFNLYEFAILMKSKGSWSVSSLMA